MTARKPFVYDDQNRITELQSGDTIVGTPLAVAGVSDGAISSADKAKLDGFLDPTIHPDCRLTKTGTPQVVPTLTLTPVTFNQEDYDPMGMHDNTTNSERIYVPYDGIYMVMAAIGFAPSTAGSFRQIRLTKNEATIRGTFNQLTPNASITIVCAQSVLRLSPGDYVNCMAYHDAGSDLTISANVTSLTLSLIRKY